MTYERACFLRALRSPDNDYSSCFISLVCLQPSVVMLFVDCAGIVTAVAILAHHLLRY